MPTARRRLKAPRRARTTRSSAGARRWPARDARKSRETMMELRQGSLTVDTEIEAAACQADVTDPTDDHTPQRRQSLHTFLCSSFGLGYRARRRVGFRIRLRRLQSQVQCVPQRTGGWVDPQRAGVPQEL